MSAPFRTAIRDWHAVILHDTDIHMTNFFRSVYQHEPNPLMKEDAGRLQRY